MNIKKEVGLSFDDVLLCPRYSRVVSRNDVSLRSPLTRSISLKIPLISANMDTITEYDTAYAMMRSGGLGILHRFMSIEKQATQCRLLAGLDEVYPVAFAVGVGEETSTRVKACLNAGANTICIDVAHADHINVRDTIVEIRKIIKLYTRNISLIVGNIATPSAALHLWQWGADTIKIGVGSGSICQTRIKTGNGIPQLTAISEIADVLKSTSVKIISDGGIRQAGDIVKALAAGADSCMIGSLFAATIETPGDISDGYKVYQGMASSRAQSQWKGSVHHIEGIATKVPLQGSILEVIEDLLDGVRSGLSYQGANNIDELRANAVFMQVSQASIVEGTPHKLSNPSVQLLVND